MTSRPFGLEDLADELALREVPAMEGDSLAEELADRGLSMCEGRDRGRRSVIDTPHPLAGDEAVGPHDLVSPGEEMERGGPARGAVNPRHEHLLAGPASSMFPVPS